MSKPLYVFPRRHTLLPVVHVENREQAERNVRIAKENGAHGAFLINHSIPFFDLVSIYAYVRQVHPSFWVGMNLLDVPDPADALTILENCEGLGLWVDNADISLGASTPTVEFQQRRLRWAGIYFGGVAFKYQAVIDDPAQAASRTASFHSRRSVTRIWSSFMRPPGG